MDAINKLRGKGKATDHVPHQATIYDEQEEGATPVDVDKENDNAQAQQHDMPNNVEPQKDASGNPKDSKRSPFSVLPPSL